MNFMNDVRYFACIIILLLIGGCISNPSSSLPWPYLEETANERAYVSYEDCHNRWFELNARPDLAAPSMRPLYTDDNFKDFGGTGRTRTRALLRDDPYYELRQSYEQACGMH